MKCLNQTYKHLAARLHILPQVNYETEYQRVPPYTLHGNLHYPVLSVQQDNIEFVNGRNKQTAQHNKHKDEKNQENLQIIILLI
ncbi:hypothetical protein HanXRQr2_Chr13g0583101 [Helianthus annuus]|uniref:Uncharacterized protein n=1 Tax=Helianthus annuus TaxID=4232 RepID=A0A9K3EH35_HELAN|nr:hypothetical protein HanXRQr2_Chr13g0583101 [Helianthus annuus]